MILKVPLGVMRRALIAMLCLVAGLVTAAPEAATGVVPQIAVSGSAEVLLPAAKASFSVGIMTSAASAPEATEANARLSKAVIAALQNAQLRRENIIGTRLVVSPRWDYDTKGRHPKLAAFEAVNTIQIDTENLARLGIYMDAAVNAGATDISEIGYTANDTDAARRQALAEAVRSARSDAEAMARAAGGTLGELLLLSNERINDTPGANPSSVMVTAQRHGPQPVSTDVTPSQIRVTAQVDARWRFVPSVAPR
jgi:uncharacterized protein YggE